MYVCVCVYMCVCVLQQQAGAGGKPGVSQVAEESEGWYRLRTVATHWSSDEEQTTPRSVKDLRDKLVSVRVKVCEGEGEGM